MNLSDKYRINEPLGQRGRKFGDNFLGERKSDGLKVVLKTIRRNSQTSLAEERLMNETSYSFMSAGLPEILDIYTSESEMIMVKRFQNGIPLNEYWRTIKKRERIKFLIQLFDGLIPIFQILEEKKIVHADIKPGNILIHEGMDQNIKVELIDFGLAIERTNIEQRKLVFPLGYAAPELLLNQLDIIDQRTDIFALGVSIWVLYADKLPLTHPNPSIFTNLQLTHPILRNDSVPRSIFKLIEKMTVKHHFATAPNKMNPSEVREKLLSAMNERINSIQKIRDELIEIDNRGFLPKNIFSKS